MMRVVIGAMASAQGIVCVSHGDIRTVEAVFACPALALCGACLLIGFLSPVVSIAIAIFSVGNALSWLPVVGGNLSFGRLASFELIVMAAAIALLGPGAFSLDAFLFGRHEIVIPPGSRAPKS